MHARISFVLFVFGVMLILGSGGIYLLTTGVIQPTVAPLPDQLVGLPLTMKMTGKQATEEFEILHNQHFPLTSGSVGMYGNKQAVLWVGGAPFDFMAEGMVNAMHDKIAEGNSPFTPIGEFNNGERIVYLLEGMGQRHYYFQSKNLVIWLAADPSVADEALQQILEVYP